jgi:hypothetical protein
METGLSTTEICCMGINHPVSTEMYGHPTSLLGVGGQLLQAALYQPGGDQNVARHKRDCVHVRVGILETPGLHTDRSP